MRGKRLAKVTAALAVLALGTSCFVGGTFAKYTTSGVGGDKARVAKFGVNVTADNSTMFNTSYSSDSKSYNQNTVISTTAIDGTEKVVAPGTSGSLEGVNITGTPEVAVEVGYEVTKLNLKGWMAKASADEEESLYFPVVFTVTVGGNETKVEALTGDYDSIEKYAAALKDNINKAIEAALADTDNVYPANKAIAAADNMPTISWEWPFETGSDETAVANNARDTYLGDKAAAEDPNPSTIEIGMTVTVDQID